MKYCPHCKQKIPVTANYCTFSTCGKPVRAPLFSWRSWRMDPLVIGFVVCFLLAFVGIKIFGGATAAELQEYTQTRAKDGMTMVYVPAGSFQMGSNESDWLAEHDEKPPHLVTLSAFWIDQTEVTNEQFAAFLNERGNQEEGEVTWLEADNSAALIEQQGDTFQPKEGFAKHPVVEVSWYGAKAYCEWAGGRLPSEAEWEYAARGPEGRIYPWGNKFDGSRANCDKSCSDGYSRTARVGTFPAGASWVGALDMAGNVWEWTNDWYKSRYDVALPEQYPEVPTIREYRVLRGGSWFNDEAGYLRGASRDYTRPSARYGLVGVRCVVSPNV